MGRRLSRLHSEGRDGVRNTIICGDCIESMRTMESSSANCCVTSPPYFGLRDYGCTGQIGLESTPEIYIAKMVEVFQEVKRVLKNDGTLWLNIGDSYAGSGKGQGPDGANDPKVNKTKGMKVETMTAQSIGCKAKDLIGIPWMLAFALRADGWYLRQDIIWHKPNPMPESVTDRCTKSHEYIFLLSKSAKYYYDAMAIKEASVDEFWTTRMDRTNDGQKYNPTEKINGIRARKRSTNFSTYDRDNNRQRGGSEYIIEDGTRNKRSVWSVNTKPYSGAHFATFPEKLIEPMIKAGCPDGGVVLDPFMGAGTTAMVAKKLGRNYVGCELNPEYIQIAEKRLQGTLGLFV